MKNKKQLSPRHQSFCEEYVETNNATKSYIAAGYSARGHSAEVMAERLMRKAEIKARIAEIKSVTSKEARLSRNATVDYLADVIETPVGSLTPDSPLVQSYDPVSGKITMVSKMDAIDKLCRMCGYFEPVKIEGTMESKLLVLFAELTGADRSNSADS